MNGRPYEVRFNLLDTYARIIFDNARLDNRAYNDAAWAAKTIGAYNKSEYVPGWVYERLRVLKCGMDATFDAPTQTLTLTAPPNVLDSLFTYKLAQIDVPSPEELLQQGVAFRNARIEQMANAASIKMGEGDALTALLRNLDADSFEAREEAEHALLQNGAPALKALHAYHPEHPSAELKNRAKRLQTRLYANAELALVRARCEAYIKAGCAGDVDTDYREFWCAKRRKEFDAAVLSFDRQKAAAVKNPILMAALLEHYRFQSDTKLEDVTFRKWRAAFFTPDAPRFDGIRLSGGRAQVLYSCETKVQDAESGAKHTERMPSSFDMVFEAGRWVAAESLPLEDPQALVWPAVEEISGDRAATSGAQAVSDGSAVGAGVWSIAANFGY